MAAAGLTYPKLSEDVRARFPKISCARMAAMRKPLVRLPEHQRYRSVLLLGRRHGDLNVLPQGR